MTVSMATPDTSTPIGTLQSAWIGHASDPLIREDAASGGIVSAILCYLLEKNEIDAALVCRTVFKDGKMVGEVFLAKTREDVLSARTSRYFDVPMLDGLKAIRAFDGRVAVIGLPSQISVFYQKIRSSAEIAAKIRYRISVFCGHNSKDELIRRVWQKHGIRENDIATFYYRKGLWRGRMVCEMKDGSVKTMRFQEFSHYQNLHVLSLDRCLNCFDHMGYFSDISTGDVWMKAMKAKQVKHSVFFSRTDAGEALLRRMLDDGAITAESTDRETVYRSQLRSINYHYNVTARARLAKFFGLYVKDRAQTQVKLRDYLGAAIVLANHRISRSEPLLRLFLKIPRFVLIPYVYLFKGLMHYRRKIY